MKRIVFVIEQLAGGGAERVTAALTNELCRLRGHEVHMVVYTRDEAVDYPVDASMRWHVLPKLGSGRLGGILGRYRFLKRTVRAIGPDVVFSLGTPRIAVLLAVAMIGSKTPLVLSERNDPRQYPVSRGWRKLRDLSYLLADGVVFQTGEARDCFPPSVRRKAAVICNPITDSLPERFEGVRQKRIVNFCRLNNQKNLDLLIDAFSDIAGAYPQHTLTIYGEGPERERLERKIRDLGLKDRVFLPGYSGNIYADIREAAMFVSSSDYEGISNSMLEAIALGVPSICTDCPAGGARETIEHGVNGLLVPVGDREAMAAAMRRVLGDRGLSDSLSQAGEALRRRISVEAITRSWLEFAERIVKAKNGGQP